MAQAVKVQSEVSLDEKVKVVAQGIFRDMTGFNDYEFTTWQEQHEELKTLLLMGGISEGFIHDAYSAERGLNVH